MSKFKKQNKTVPAISTASLPDIVFMLLFFFMTVTSMRETEFKIKEPQLPNAHDVKKIEDKNLVSTIYIGRSRDENNKGDVLQLNDKIGRVQDVRAFVLNNREGKSEEDISLMQTMFKADKGTKLGTIADIKKELREIDALKIAYAASETFNK